MTDRYVRYAKRADQAITPQRWVLAWAAYHAPNKTEFANAMGVHRDTPHRWANIYGLYHDLRVSDFPTVLLRGLRKALRPTIWEAVVKKRNQYDLSLVECLEWLEMAYLERMTRELLNQAIDQTHDAEMTLEQEVERTKMRYENIAERIRQNSGILNPDQWERAEQAALLLEGVAKELG